MKPIDNKYIPYFIVFIPLSLVLIVSFVISSFYLEKVTNYYHSAKERAIDEHVDSKKAKSEVWVKQLNLLFDYRNSRVEEETKKELQTRVNMAYESARFIYEKYKGKKTHKEIQEQIIDVLQLTPCSNYNNCIFLTDYKGNSILNAKQQTDTKPLINYEDADGRAIILEELQIVRKKSEGFIYSRSKKSKTREIILVKDLRMFGWFIGSSMHIVQKQEDLKKSLLEMVQRIPLDESDFMGLYDNKKAIFLSSKMGEKLGSEYLDVISKNLLQEAKWYKDKVDGYYYYSEYYKPFDWHLVYGFDVSAMNNQELKKQQDLEKVLDDELLFIMKSSAGIVIFIVILSLLLSRKINQIFKHYQQEVQKRTDELQRLNESLEQRVFDELESHRQKDKILIQKSKMAEMGDMLSMIAHQWRQPLNQMSYIFMNIDSAYDYKELNKEYLNIKIKEGTDLLEFMSVTIDDFRNYFRPEKEKQFVLVSDAIKKSVGLISKSLENDGIEIELYSSGRDLTHIYNNEFMQVILNLIKNSKDVLVQNKVKNPKITITSTCQEDKLIVKVCDNGGGIDEKIKDKIFEPYFSTKDKKSGTGLGLYMSKMIIEEHLNGKLTVANTKEGVCFIIEL
ncbi:cache domain-containing protein [bacterium]|nr:cache domain-containing protein [bacterium]MBU1993312.1 cache domain-containing protein [bacterium]